jgi:hypothetical protein
MRTAMVAARPSPGTWSGCERTIVAAHPTSPPSHHLAGRRVLRLDRESISCELCASGSAPLVAAHMPRRIALFELCGARRGCCPLMHLGDATPLVLATLVVATRIPPLPPPRPPSLSCRAQRRQRVLRRGTARAGIGTMPRDMAWCSPIDAFVGTDSKSVRAQPHFRPVTRYPTPRPDTIQPNMACFSRFDAFVKVRDLHDPSRRNSNGGPAANRLGPASRHLRGRNAHNTAINAEMRNAT